MSSYIREPPYVYNYGILFRESRIYRIASRTMSLCAWLRGRGVRPSDHILPRPGAPCAGIRFDQSERPSTRSSNCFPDGQNDPSITFFFGLVTTHMGALAQLAPQPAWRVSSCRPLCRRMRLNSNVGRRCRCRRHVPNRTANRAGFLAHVGSIRRHRRTSITRGPLEAAATSRKPCMGFPHNAQQFHIHSSRPTGASSGTLRAPPDA